mmetsp:Transcript_77758/g.209588  ORF Transcript_77758/g.209588 Transcript_77758/m.209588 type:complete len:156 (-) Transcript_77758:101-568(-)
MSNISKAELPGLELGLVYDVMMDDMIWLDSYQTSILRRSVSPCAARISGVDDEEVSAADHCAESVNIVQTSSSADPTVSDSNINGLEDLPAGEFVRGRSSMILRETMRLMRQAHEAMLQTGPFQSPNMKPSIQYSESSSLSAPWGPLCCSSSTCL